MYPGGFWSQSYWPLSYWPKTGKQSGHGSGVGGRGAGRRSVVHEMMRIEQERSLLDEFAKENLRKLSLRVEANRRAFMEEKSYQKQVTTTAVWAAILSEI